MSFLGKILHGIETGAKITAQISQGPLVSMAVGFLPGGGMVTAAVRLGLKTAGDFSASVLKAEATNSTPGAGAERAALVKADFDDGIAIWKAVENAQGNDVVYDEALFAQIRDAQVFVFNNSPKLIASIHVIPLAGQVAA